MIYYLLFIPSVKGLGVLYFTQFCPSWVNPLLVVEVGAGLFTRLVHMPQGYLQSCELVDIPSHVDDTVPLRDGHHLAVVGIFVPITTFSVQWASMGWSIGSRQRSHDTSTSPFNWNCSS